MRRAIFAASILTVTTMSSAFAAGKPGASAPSWDDCYRLGMARGVHLENQELPGFMDQCLAGLVPFETDGVVVARQTIHNRKTNE